MVGKSQKSFLILFQDLFEHLEQSLLSKSQWFIKKKRKKQENCMKAKQNYYSILYDIIY